MEVVLNFVSEIMVIIITAVLAMSLAWVKKQIDISGLKKFIINLEIKEHELALIKEITRRVVIAVQETERAKSGEAKLSKAKMMIADQLRTRGITISAEEIDAFIHGILKEVKKEFGEEWKK